MGKNGDDRDEEFDRRGAEAQRKALRTQAPEPSS